MSRVKPVITTEQKSPMPTTDSHIYKICSADLWADAESARLFTGAGIDIADGYIHFSTDRQLHETADRHFAGQDGLMLICVATAGLALVWEPSRGGDLFPHLYHPLDLAHVVWARPLARLASGDFDWPEGLERAAGQTG